MPKRFLSLAALAAVVSLTGLTGCSHIPFIGKRFQHKHDQERVLRQKGSSHVATDAEKEFKERWVTKRANDLLSQGLTAEAARAQAVAEFGQKFPATHVAGR